MVSDEFMRVWVRFRSSGPRKSCNNTHAVREIKSIAMDGSICLGGGMYIQSAPAGWRVPPGVLFSKARLISH